MDEAPSRPRPPRSIVWAGVGALVGAVVVGVGVAAGSFVVAEAGALVMLAASAVALSTARASTTKIAELEGRLADLVAVDAVAREAKAASRAKSAFVANVSHEIRTPMTAIVGYTDLLLLPGLSPTEVSGYVQTIRRNSEHLLTVIDDVLDLSKVEAGKMTLESTTCSPVEIVSDLLALMRARASAKNLSLSVEYATPIPDTIETDPTRLRQILLNLVGNAIKFTSVGDVQVIVRCEGGDTDSPRLRFDVKDTGVGIRAEAMSRLFMPFSQCDDSTTRRFGGTGLGLAISHHLAKMLGGGITVESEPDVGSVFSLTIATGSLAGVNIAEVEEPEKEITGVTVVLPDQVRLNGRILLVEDAPDSQVLIATHLERAGAKVSLAGDGRVAVDAVLAAVAAGQPFDLVLMDMQMPELDGCAATAELRAAGYKRPIVALTANAMAEDRARCLEAGCDDYLTKPIQRVKLLSVASQQLFRAQRDVRAVRARALALLVS